MWASRWALGSIVVLFLLIAVARADAKGSEPFRIVRPSGKVSWVVGVAAKTWWHDYFSAGTKTNRGCSCTSPAAAARYAQRITQHWKRWPQPWLLVPTSGASMLYYPATGTTPGYILTPVVLGGKERWDDWEIATQRMAAIIRRAAPVL